MPKSRDPLIIGNTQNYVVMEAGATGEIKKRRFECPKQDPNG